MTEPSRVYWTPEDDAKLLELRSDLKKWKEIGVELGRSRTACHHRYSHLVPKDEHVKFSRRTWTTEQEDQLRKLRFQDGLTIPEIAIFIGKTAVSIQSKLCKMAFQHRRIHFEVSQRVVPSQASIDDRNRRMMAERDLTSMFFGDPAPGQSALDRKRAMVAA